MSFLKGSQAAHDVIALLHTVGRLKDTPRQGWVEHGVSNPESVSDHMYRMSLMCMMCPDTSLNRDHMVKMALCHDTGESIIGDISPAMGVPKEVKKDRETEAVRQLCALASSSPSKTFTEELQALFNEYEAQESPESHFVKDMDLLEMILQARSYEAAHPGKDLSSFFLSGGGLRHPWARAIFETLLETRLHPTYRGDGKDGAQQGSNM